MPRFTDRTGEENLSLQGNLMRIIRYGNSHDIDVLFVDTGYIARNKNYRDFTKGLIRDTSIKGTKRIDTNAYNKKFIGRVYPHKLYNMNMTIIDYDKNKGACIVFDDGFKMSNLSLAVLARGTIERPDYIKIMNESGTYAYYKSSDIMNKVFTSALYGKYRIIRWGSATDIDIEFLSDSAIVNTNWFRIKNGTVTNPNNTEARKSLSKEGEVNTNNKGYKMKIIAYRNCNDIDVEFEDGTKVFSATYYSFQHGRLRKPFNKNNYLGKVYNNWKIEKFNNNEYIQARCLLCDTVYDNIRFYDIIKDKSKCCNSCSRAQTMHKRWGSEHQKRIGSVINNYKVLKRLENKKWLVECAFCNEKYEISNEVLMDSDKTPLCKCQIGFKYNDMYFKNAKEFHSYLTNIYKDNVIAYKIVCDLVKNNDLDEIIKRCEIKSKYGSSIIKDRLYEQNIMKNGQVATIIGLIDSHNLTVRFEDDTETTGCYRNFKNGTLENPNFKLVGSKRNRDVVVKGACCGSFDVLDFGYRLNNDRDVYYICQCKYCGYKDILSPKQMLEHKC